MAPSEKMERCRKNRAIPYSQEEKDLFNTPFLSQQILIILHKEVVYSVVTRIWISIFSTLRLLIYSSAQQVADNKHVSTDVFTVWWRCWYNNNVEAFIGFHVILYGWSEFPGSGTCSRLSCIHIVDDITSLSPLILDNSSFHSFQYLLASSFLSFSNC